MQGYINQVEVERSGKIAGTTRDLAATFLSRPCLGGEEFGQSGTEKRVIHKRSAHFVPWSMIFYFSYFLKAIQNYYFVHSNSMHANDVHG